MRKGLVLAASVALVLGLGLVVAERGEAAEKLVEQFICNAVNMSGVGARNAGTVIIGIERWSSEEERELLRNTFLQKGQDALLGALQSVKPRVGYMRLSNTLAWDLMYARSTKNEDGTRRVFLATDRRVAFGEVAGSTRSLDYAFTLVEIHFDAKGKGEGKLSLGVKIEVDPKTNQIELENYAQRPVDLINVRIAKQK
jgi:hypothetical protein